MAVLNNTGIRAGASASVADPYLIKQSLRFNAGDEAYLSKTLSSAGDLKKWTFNCWWKNKADATAHAFFGCRPSATNDTTFCVRVETDGTIKIGTENEGIRQTTQTFRDPGAWMMLTVIMDTANGTADDRCQIWVNGERVTAFSSNATITQNREFGWNKAAEMNIGRMSSLGYYSGLTLSDIYFIDGQALEPSAFGELDDNKTWQPKEPVFPSTPTGNSFNFKFETAANIGKDTLRPKLATATGGKPILTTTDDFGEVTGGAVNTSDSNKSHIVLAVSGHNSIADVHHTVKGSGSAKTATANGNAALSTDESRFYGQSIKCDGTGDYVSFADSADWDIGSSDACGECWVYGNSWGGYENLFGQWNNSNYNVTNSWIMEPVSGTLNFYYCHGSSIANITGASLPVKQWTHVAFTKDGSTLTLYQNGIQTGTGTLAGTIQNGTGTFDIGGNAAGGGSLNGYIQDVRLYKGTKKYTGNFIPPVRNDWSSTNLTATTGDELVTKTIVNNSSDWTNLTTQDVDFGTIGHLQSIAMNRWDQGLIHAVKVNNSRLEDNGTEYSASNRFTFNPNTTHWVTNHDNTKMFDSDDATYASASNSNQANAGFTWSAVSPSDLNIRDVNLKVRSWGDGTGAQLVVKHNLYKTQDILTDSPTNYLPEGGNDALGGVTRGNYCTWNPLCQYGTTTLSDGNLKAVTTTNSQIDGTFLMSPTVSGNCTGKWYFEWKCATAAVMQIGIVDIDGNKSAAPPGGANKNGIIYLTTTASGDTNTGKLYNNATEITTGWPSCALNSVVMVAYDAATGKLWFGKDGTWFNTGGSTGNPATGAHPAITVSADYRGQMVPVCGAGGGSDAANGYTNFGQRAYAHAAPTGFKSLCTTNLPTPSIPEPWKHFDVVTYTGTGSSLEVNGLNFQPDLLWFKSRSNADENHLQDAIRGVTKMLQSDTNAAEITDSNLLTSFDSDGFTLPADSSGETNNENGWTYVSWAWDAGTAAGTVKSGATGQTITASNTWYNQTAGFEMMKYSGTGSAGKIGHNLNAAPSFILIKQITDSSSTGNGDGNWIVGHDGLGAGSGRLIFNGDHAWDSGGEAAVHWNSTTPTNELVGLGTSGNVNGSGSTYMMYAWTAIPGYSAFGSYTGNNSANGPFIHTGFLPKWLIVKRIDGVKGWMLIDTTRNPYNVVQGTLYPHDDDAEHTGTGHRIDLNSNGFKVRDANDRHNASGGDYLYCAFAELPFKFSRAR